MDSLWYNKSISKRLLSAYTLSSSPFTLQSTHTCTGRREAGPDMPVFKFQHLIPGLQYELETEDSKHHFGPRGIAQCWCGCSQSLNLLCGKQAGCWLRVLVLMDRTLGHWLHVQQWWRLLAFEPLCSPARDAPISAVPREVVIPAAYKATRDQGDWLSILFWLGHSLPVNPGVARFLGTRTNWDTFLVLCKLWMVPWVSYGTGTVFCSKSVTFDFSSTPGCTHLLPRLILENTFTVS